MTGHLLNLCAKCTNHRNMQNCKQIMKDPKKPKKEVGPLKVEENQAKQLNIDKRN